MIKNTQSQSHSGPPEWFNGLEDEKPSQCPNYGYIVTEAVTSYTVYVDLRFALFV
jgi:hypothetical protein